MPATFLRRLLAGVAIAVTTLLSACAGTAIDRAGPRLDDPELHAFVHRLACELTTPCDSLRIVLIDAPQQQAELLADGRLSVRLGMLLALEEDCELAFVLAHEIAHHRNDHRATASIAARLPMELEADAAALAATTALGYPEDCGARLIRRLQPVALDERTQQAGREQLQVRLQALPPPTGRAAAPSEAWKAVIARHRAAAGR